MEEKYIASLDIGTTTVRCYIFNTRAEIVGKATEQVVLHYPQVGYVEIDPDELWQSIIGVVKKSIKDASLSAGQITALGLSTQRSTYITWSRSTGLPFHRFVTWKDLRADKMVKQWNDSVTWKAMRAGSYALYFILRNKRFRAGSVLKFMNTQTTMRLAWSLENVPELKEATKRGDAMFGTLDTWLLYKLTGGRLHVTDVSSASATGFFDPFTVSWAGWALRLLAIPAAMLPRVVDTAGGHFACTERGIWGAEIPILSSMADQTAAMWGSCCFRPGDVKLTMGTGTFLDINTGGGAHASVAGLYPLAGWRAGGRLVYVAEGANNDTGSIVEWAQSCGLFEKPEETSDIATSVSSSDGVYFVPAFSGLGPPHNDTTCGSGYIGVRATTKKAHLVRALLESIAFRTFRLYDCVRSETSYALNTIRLDGGVANNDFIAQLVADLSGLRVERPQHTEMSALGCAYCTGLQLGVWKSQDELSSLYRVGRVFEPRASVREAYAPVLSRWEDAVRRLGGWHAAGAAAAGAGVGDASVELATPRSGKVTKATNGKRSSSGK